MPYPILGAAPYAAPPPPDPLSLGAIEWHRADAVTLTGALIDTWTDLSGNGRTKVLSGGNVNTRATQLPTSAPGSQPSASAPNPFAASTTGYDGAFGHTFIAPGGQFSLMAIVKPDASVDDNLVYRFAYGQRCTGATNIFDGAVTFWDPFSTPGIDQLKCGVFNNGGGQAPGPSFVLSPGQWIYTLYCVDWGLGVVTAYRNGVQVLNTTTGDVAVPVGTPTSYLLRNAGGGAAFDNSGSWFGEQAEHAFFPTSLETDGTVSLLTDYVRSRYGTTIAPP